MCYCCFMCNICWIHVLLFCWYISLVACFIDLFAPFDFWAFVVCWFSSLTVDLLLRDPFCFTYVFVFGQGGWSTYEIKRIVELNLVEKMKQEVDKERTLTCNTMILFWFLRVWVFFFDKNKSARKIIVGGERRHKWATCFRAKFFYWVILFAWVRSVEIRPESPDPHSCSCLGPPLLMFAWPYSYILLWWYVNCGIWLWCI